MTFGRGALPTLTIARRLNCWKATPTTQRSFPATPGRPIIAVTPTRRIGHRGGIDAAAKVAGAWEGATTPRNFRVSLDSGSRTRSSCGKVTMATGAALDNGDVFDEEYKCKCCRRAFPSASSFNWRQKQAYRSNSNTWPAGLPTCSDCSRTHYQQKPHPTMTKRDVDRTMNGLREMQHGRASSSTTPQGLPQAQLGPSAAAPPAELQP